MEPKTSDDRKTRAKQSTAPNDDQPILTIAATPKPKTDDLQGAGEWLSQMELCDRYRLSYQNLSTRAHEHGSLEAYLESATGYCWEVERRGRSKYFRQLS